MQITKLWMLLATCLLLSGCAHGARGSARVAPGAAAARDMARCNAAGEDVEVLALQLFHLPTDAARKAWRAVLGGKAEDGAVEELVIHLGTPPSQIDGAKWERFQKNPNRESATELLLDTTVAIRVCDDEVAAVMKKLQAPEDADRERYRDLTASLLGVAGGLQYLSEVNWHTAVHIFEAIEFGDRVKKMFERADDDIDTVDSNL